MRAVPQAECLPLFVAAECQWALIGHDIGRCIFGKCFRLPVGAEEVQI